MHARCLQFLKLLKQAGGSHRFGGWDVDEPKVVDYLLQRKMIVRIDGGFAICPKGLRVVTRGRV
ncbi:MAG: hypothetical protein B7733_06225 [Myxococcales bacterium FL481]|nr:MAG: hypothetical protein B7733_06225 [Myxococcales bacterium FL481]